MKTFPRMIFLSMTLATLTVILFVSDCTSQPPISPYPNGSEVDSQSPPPQIIYFKAEPSVIREGGISFLKWKTENVKSVSISGGIGPVVPADRGQISVRPKRGTTYTLTATNDFIQFVEENTKVTVIKRLRKRQAPAQ